ncbi:hypothetical protein MUO14_20350 [Halobacillus shinanisalinarum]|uniref:Sulfatase-modifying factor enzyme domain-containing protein n=1 Tax=Halobacillus shinanisalinarum TaxID=2932258 RepID=A0ABY4GX50_9BACI|nr:hypothetical protein [Halobacillus shinanisalinarum]UOQ92742.1 hypothetical protein MUO14_20350 [Halobacillus shinanisalinarum]
MQKIYLSIIALLTLTLFVTNNGENTKESKNVEKSLDSTEVFKPYETYGVTINTSEFRNYFSGVEAKKTYSKVNRVWLQRQKASPRKSQRSSIRVTSGSKEVYRRSWQIGNTKN